MDYKGFRDLECYREGRNLRIFTAGIIKKLPPFEKFLLISQMRRASRSVTTNIAEGYGRFTYKDTRNFFLISRGSVAEIIEHFTIALDEGYISKEEFGTGEELCSRVFRLINGYISYLERQSKL